MGKIKVGEYVRTKTGYIDKIKGIDTSFDNTKYYILDDDYIIFKTQIIKHSKNIIDLIQVGDYVNGNKVVEVKSRLEGYIEVEAQAFLGYHFISYKDIKSIVTKEQFNQIKYEV